MRRTRSRTMARQPAPRPPSWGVGRRERRFAEVPSLIADPRVEQTIRDVHQEVEHQQQDRVEQNESPTMV